MRFFSSHTIANSSKPPIQSQTQRPFMPLMIRPLPIQQSNETGTPNLPPVQYQNEPPKKVKWGEPTWFLLHTLSVKIKDADFYRIKHELLNRVYAICVNLPCPDCANHAKTYLDNINFNAIQTKEDFKKMLHAFHNEVNQRKGYPYFPYEQLNEKYSLAITVNIIRNFMVHFSDRNRSIKLLATDLHRTRLCASLKEWFNENITCFDP